MGTLISRRNIVAIALIATLATATYAFFSPDAMAPSVVNADTASTDTVIETEVLAEVELPTPSGRLLDVDMSGFIGDIDVDLATLDPSVLVVDDYRLKYIATTDELVLGRDAGGEFPAISLDVDSDGLGDVVIADLSPSNGTDTILAVPEFSKLPENDESFNFSIVEADGTELQVLLDATIGDLVFADLNDNGIHDSDERGIAGITIQLLDETGAELAQTTTDSSGNYSFTVGPGTYALIFGAQPGTAFVERGIGDDQEVDSNATQLNGRTLPIFIGPGVENLSIDAGLTT